MTQELARKKPFWSDFIPKSWICWKEGYTAEILQSDLLAGITVGLIALPLAMAFAIGSGISPERGLFTAIIAGFLISLLGGSRVQIGGPTGAFVVIVYSIVHRHGYEGLALATLIAGLMMLLFGFARAGVLLKFIPYPVTTGFTTGIALVIFSGQIKDLFGLEIKQVPADFIEKWKIFLEHASSCNPWALGLSVAVLVSIFWLRWYRPKIPGAIIAVIFATVIVSIFDLPIETIGKKFGGIPRTLPLPTLPSFSWDMVKAVFPDAITIALLGSIESLLSAVVADAMTGNKHRSNCELVAQGFANIGSVFFGGIPATGAIARTTANIKMGAKTPLAGMMHAIALMLLMIFCAPLAKMIPLSALGAILVYVAWNMSEMQHFTEILKGQKSDSIVLVITFLLTVLIDLSVAVQVGVILAAILFLYRMADTTTLEVCKILVEENAHESPELHDSDIIFRKDVPKDVLLFELQGPFFFGVSDLLNEELRQIVTPPKVFILRMRHVPAVDATGIYALKQFSEKCRQKGIVFLIAGLNPQIKKLFHKTSIVETVGSQHIFSNLNAALDFARHIP